MIHAIKCGVEGKDPVAVVIQVDGSGNKFVAIPWGGLTGTREENAATIVSLLQNFIDRELDLDDLSAEEPAKTVDPNLERMFWNAAETHLISRDVIVISADWDVVTEAYDVNLRDARSVAKE